MALLDTGSEVTTVTDEWARGHIQDLQLKQTQEWRWWTCLRPASEDVPILVVKDLVDVVTSERRRRVSLLLGKNVLDQIMDSTADVAQAVQAAVHEAHLEKTLSTKGLARAAGNTPVPGCQWV